MEGLIFYGTGDEHQGPVVTINIKGKDSSEVADKLNDRGIAVRAGFHCAPLAHKTIGTLDLGAVRFSLSYFNTEEEIRETIKAVEEILKEDNDVGRI